LEIKESPGFKGSGKPFKSGWIGDPNLESTVFKVLSIQKTILKGKWIGLHLLEKPKKRS
jgi:hypothetical protein